VHARIAQMTAHGAMKMAGLWTKTFDPSGRRCGAIKPMPKRVKPISHGATSWMKEIPKLPIPACRPKAVPCKRFGKKYPVEGINPAKTPPPKPEAKEMASNSQK